MAQAICVGRCLVRHRTNKTLKSLLSNRNSGILFYHTNPKKQIPNLLYHNDVSISSTDTLYAYTPNSNSTSYEGSAPSRSNASMLGKLTINDQNEELAKWIRNSYIDTSLGNGQRHHTENALNENNVMLDASGGGYLYGIPAVDNDTFNIIWRYKFCIGDSHTVDVVVKRINNRRTIFTLEQLLPLLSALKYLKRDSEIHKIYTSYSKHLRYFLEDTDPTVNPDQREKLLELFMFTEARLKHYTNCEVIFSDYIKYSRIKSEIIVIGLKSFIENNNLQLAKEFFIQIMSNKETFPLTPRGFHSFLLYLNKTANYKSIDYFSQMWLHYQDENTVEHHLNNHALLAFMHSITLSSRNAEKLSKFLHNETIKNSGYLNSEKYHLTKFYYDLFKLPKNGSNHFEVVAIPIEIQDRIRHFHSQLSSDIPERRLFYLSLLKCFNLCNNLMAIENVLKLIDADKDVSLDSHFHTIMIQYFTKHGEIDNLKKYYKTLFTQRVPISDNSLVLSMAACFKQYDPNMFPEFKNEMLSSLCEQPKYMLWFPWIRDLKSHLDSIRKLPIIDLQTCNKFNKALKDDDMLAAKTLLISRCRDGIMPRVQMFYILLEKCLHDGHVSLASMIDQMIKDMYSPLPHITTKVQLLWLKHNLKTTVGTQAIKRERIARIESMLKEDDSSFQNLVQLADIYLGIHDFENCSRLLTQAHAIICNEDKEQWLMYYSTLLKMHAREKQMGHFITVLRKWNNNEQASYLEITTAKLLKSYTRYFTKDLNAKLDELKDDEDPQTRSYLISFHESGMKHIKKELAVMGDRYGRKKIESLATMKDVVEFVSLHLKVKATLRKQQYGIKKQELADKFAEYK